MKKFIFLIMFGILLAARSAVAAVAGSTVAAQGVTLEECYRQALRVSETLAISEQEIRQLEAQYRQGVGDVLPEVSWVMTQFWQDASGVDVGTGTVLRTRRPESYFQVQQPIFAGLRDYNAVKAIGAETEGSRSRREQAALNLLGDVANVFYIALDLQQELEVLDSQHRLTADRLKELQRRVRVGRSRQSEILSARVELVSLDALIQDTAQRWGIARQTLQFLTEIAPEVPLQGAPAAPGLPALEQALDRSLARPDLRAAAQAQERERYLIRFAQGDFWPIVDLTGRYYTERVDFNQDINWDALLNVEVPIFSGFMTREEVKQARSRLTVADLDAARLTRLVKQEVRTAHQNLRYTLEQAGYYKQAVDLAAENYRIQQEEYRLGLITNLEVLQVLNDLQDLRLRKLRTDTSVMLFAVRLRVATGEGL